MFDESEKKSSSVGMKNRSIIILIVDFSLRKRFGGSSDSSFLEARVILQLSFGRTPRENASTGGPYPFIGFQQSKEARGGTIFNISSVTRLANVG